MDRGEFVGNCMADGAEPFCKNLQKSDQDTLLSLEEISVSKDSPGRVENGETLWRQMINPVHFDAAKGEYKATAFSDVSSIGASVNRGYENLQSIRDRALARVAQQNAKGLSPEKKLVQLLPLSCEEVRSIHVNSTRDGAKLRCFIVLDTARPDDESHADICQIVSEQAHARSARSALVEIANRYLSSNPVEFG